MTAAGVAHLRIKLNDVEPTVARRVEAPLAIRLDRLHLMLQAAMGCGDSHLYEFRAHDTGWGVPDPDLGDGPLDARKARLVDVVQDTGVRSLEYLYDSGDGWEHTIRVERIRDIVPGITYPRPIQAKSVCHGSARSRNRDLRVAKPGESNWDSALPCIVGSRRPTSPANDRSGI